MKEIYQRDHRNRKKLNIPEYGRRWFVKDRIRTFMRQTNTTLEELEPGELDKMIEFYMNRPEKFEVDHIIPKTFGGKQRLHNLQYLPYNENCKKTNKLCFFTKSCGKYLAVKQ